MKRPPARLPLTATFLVLTVGYALFVYFYLIRPQGPFAWDEAHHSFFSLAIAKSILNGDWNGFLRWTNTQLYWPFLHSWGTAPFLLVCGFTYAAARCASLFFGMLSLLLLYRIASRLYPGKGPATGLLAVLLALLCPMFLYLSSAAMIEDLGLFLTLVLILLQFRTWESKRVSPDFFSGLVLGLLYLSKYIYAIFFGTALLFFWLSALLFREGMPGLRTLPGKIAFTALGFLIPFGLWMAVPPSAAKLNVVLYRLGDTPAFNPFHLEPLESRLFYLRALLYAYTFSPGIFLLYGCGIAYGLARWRQPRPRFLLLLFLAIFVSMSCIRNGQERFIFTSVPALFLLTAGFITWLWSAIRARWRWVFSAVLALLVLGDLHRMPAYIREVGSMSVHGYTFSTNRGIRPTTLFGLASYPGFLRYPRTFYNPDALVAPARDTGDLVGFVFENTDPRQPLCVPFYLGTLSPHLWRWHAVQENRLIFIEWHPASRSLVTLTVEKDSPYYTLGNKRMIDGRNADWSACVEGLEARGLVKPLQEKHFPDMGLSVKIYERACPPGDAAWRSLHFP